MRRINNKKVVKTLLEHLRETPPPAWQAVTNWRGRMWGAVHDHFFCKLFGHLYIDARAELPGAQTCLYCQRCGGIRRIDWQRQHE